MQKMRLLMLTLIGTLLFSNSVVFAQVESAFTDMELVFEEVEDIQVTSLSGTAQELKTTPAAIYVISEEDIMNSGATTVAELLRMVPGLQVGAISANSWSVSVRGFSGRYSSNLQVLLDGRSVYNHLFSGVYWESLNVIFEDIERIEIIRGPGSTLWGANAVNGVINIVTKNSEKTKSTLLKGIAGTEENKAVFRFGSTMSDKTSLRIYGSYLDRDSFVDLQGEDIDDSLEVSTFGTRFDYKGYDLDASLVIEAYDNEQVNVGTGVDPTSGGAVLNKNPEDITGGSVNFNLNKKLSDSAGLEFISYYDNHNREDNFIEREDDVYFAELRNNFKIGESNDFIWGIGYKKTEQATETFIAGTVEFIPSERDFEVFSCFLQDTISLSDNAFLMLGAKYEDSNITGDDIQPSVRFSYKFNDDVVWWASYTNAIRTPSRAELDIRLPVAFMPLPNGTIMPIYLTGNPEIDNENLTAVETGLRVDFSDTFSMDISLFVNEYEDVIYQNASILSVTNEQEATIQGGELLFNYKPSDRVNIKAGVSVLDLDFDLPDAKETSEAELQYSLLGRFGITDKLSINTELYHVSEKESLNVDSFFKADLGLVYKISDSFEVSLWGLNLTEEETEQYYDSLVLQRREQVERAFYLKVKLLK